MSMSSLHLRPLSAILLAFLFAASPVSAQKKDQDIKFRLAQSYERSGDYVAAVAIYKELYRSDSLNVVLIESLKRDLLQLKRYDEAITLFQSILRRSPTDINLLGQLGSIYAQNAEQQKAMETWERAVAVDPAKETTYRFIGSWVVQSRLFDYAITLYKRGRTACGDPQLFTSDIGYLYGIMLNYAEATKEYLSLLTLNPGQLNFVQSRIATYTGKADGLAAATNSVAQAAKADPANMGCQKLLAWLYMEAKDFAKAYDVYRGIDEKTKAGGKELFTFAERTLREKGYAVASKAYASLISGYPKAEFLAQAKFGYARTLEELDLEKDTSMLFGPVMTKSGHPESESNPAYAGAIAAYAMVVTEFPTLEVAPRALYRIAEIQYERFADLDASRASLEKLIATYPSVPHILVDARLLLGEVSIAQGDVARAAAQYESVAGKAPYIGEQRERAAFQLAELDYYAGRFKECLAKLADLTRNPASDAANDALGLQIFVQENTTAGDAAIKEFAQAALLQRSTVSNRYSRPLPDRRSSTKR
jgi:tetratricopeptide (TPR) repeat protein